MSIMNLSSSRMIQHSLPRRLLHNHSGVVSIALFFVFCCVVFSLITSNFLTGTNWLNIIRQSAPLLIVATAMTLVITTGGIDLSVGSTLALVGALSAIALNSWGLPWPVVLLGGLLLGGFVGAINGFFIAYEGIPAFIVTLATLAVVRGIALLVTQGYSIPVPADSLFTFIGRAWVVGIPMPALIGMMMTLKGLPLAYNKDMQEDKEGLFDALDTWLDCLHMGALVLDGIQVKRPRCQEAAQQGYANSTELADYLVAKGVPFREAHHIVGEAVVEAIRQGKALEELALADLQKFSAVIGDDVYPILALQSCLDKRAAKGGVSPKQVAQAIADAKNRLV